MNYEEIDDLRIKKVHWNTQTLGFTLTNGETCTAGSQKAIKSHTFDPNKKITKIKMITNETED